MAANFSTLTLTRRMVMGRRIVLTHDRGALARAAGGGRAAIDQQHAAGAERGQVIGSAGTRDARADDDYVVGHSMPQVRLRLRQGAAAP